MRRIIVKLHRWIGIVLAIYVVMICLTGSVLVYRPELFSHFEPKPVVVERGERLLTDEQLLAAAGEAFPGYEPNQLWRGREEDNAVEIELLRDGSRQGELFDPYTGEALGPALNLGYRATDFLLKLHAQLLGGDSGRAVNGALGLFFVFLALTGVLAWRPHKRRRPKPEKTPHTIGNWTMRRLHKTTGIWAAVFVLMWAVTGVHLAYPWIFDSINEYFDPFDEMNPVERVGDQISYWLAYVHFGRFGGRLPGCEWDSACSEGLKALWSVLALVPAMLAVTGLWMWLRGLRARARVRRLAEGGESG